MLCEHVRVLVCYGSVTFNTHNPTEVVFLQIRVTRRHPVAAVWSFLVFVFETKPTKRRQSHVSHVTQCTTFNLSFQLF